MLVGIPVIYLLQNPFTLWTFVFVQVKELKMKRIIKYGLLFSIGICMFSACSNAQSPPPEKEERLNKGSVLIVYLSRTGNTEAIAEMIHNEVGGTMVELELETPYPEDYDAIVAQVDRENETGYLPPS